MMIGPLAACAGRTTGSLQPVAAAPGASTVDILVATTRAASALPGELYSGERGSKLSLTDITVSIPPPGVHRVGQVEWPSRVPPNPAREFAALKIVPLTQPGSGGKWVKEHTPRNRRVLIFVHGFNNRFEDAVFRFAQIVHDSRADVAPILFTWPSSASVFGYNYDRESTNYSRDALEEILQTAARDSDVGEVTILAHSMGTWLVMEALRQMAIRDGRVAGKIRNVVLASPDIDVDVFARQWAEFGTDKPKLTVFVSQDDRALSLSRRIAGNVDRLGQINPNVEPYKSALERSGIDVIDLTVLKTSGDQLNHGKFAESPEVVRAIGTRLVSGQAITDSEIGIGEHIGSVVTTAAQTVGTGAALAISAPLAIVDPVTRRNYPAQMDRFGKSVTNTIGSVGDTVGTTVETVGKPIQELGE
ncbi:alpha/beta hydrolase [Rhodoligotrophos appendicifer]|uniref:alpha/beta hydrolase n=1 Tax=Rhodoligotrophos appendicifer TaxID=987056 RepID=UPI0011857C40